MEKAFAAPRLDFYEGRQFALDRQVLQEQGLDRPDMLLAGSFSQPVPNLAAINLYEAIQLQDIGEAAEKAGRTEEAVAAYWSVVHFGEKLGASPMGIAQIISNKVRHDGYNHILPLVHSKGRNAEAATVESALASLPSFDHNLLHGPADSSLEATARRSARIVMISAIFVALLGTATILWLMGVVALKWKADIGGSRLLNHLASSFCFAPPALLFASIALFLGFYPYARSIAQFHSYKELEYGYAPVLMGLYDGTRFGTLNDVWLSRMFWLSVWCVAIALVGVCVLAWVRNRARPRPDHLEAA